MATLERFPEGSLRIEIGIQTLNPTVAGIVSRRSNPEVELELLENLRLRTRAIVHADLIAGLPGEDIASFAAGFDRLLATSPAEIQLGILKKLPGTPLARHDGAFCMRYASRPPYEVLSTSTMDVRDIARLKNFARFWELIVNRGHFEDLLPRILPETEGAFARFLSIAEALEARFGRNWGIDRQALRSALEEAILL